MKHAGDPEFPKRSGLMLVLGLGILLGSGWVWVDVQGIKLLPVCAVMFFHTDKTDTDCQNTPRWLQTLHTLPPWLMKKPTMTRAILAIISTYTDR